MSRDHRSMLVVVFVSFLISVLLQTSALPVEVDASSGGGKVKTVLTQQVPYGDTVTLLCRSNDANHNFLYWHLDEKNTIVGPGNSYDNAKFRFEVLSGNLTIKAVSDSDKGLYNCVSRGVKKDDINIRSVRMIVTKDWEEVYENDSSVNTFRIVVIIFTLTLLSVVGYVAYRIYKNRFRHPSYLIPSDDDEDDDSGEELFRAPERSTGSNRNRTENIVLNSSSTSFDSPGISTDFKSILDTANNK